MQKFGNARPSRITIEDMCRYICTQSGFCGGPGYAPDLIAQMTSINAADFAWAVLEAEGMAETFEYDTSWRPYFEAMFMDIFGDGDFDLEG